MLRELRSSNDTQKGLVFFKELAEAGQIQPVIERHYPLEQTVDAHPYAENGHKKGRVVVTLDPDRQAHKRR
ncbi:MAG: zinc-binding dehydrogenase [Thermomicrobiales bacterium]